MKNFIYKTVLLCLFFSHALFSQAIWTAASINGTTAVRAYQPNSFLESNGYLFACSRGLSVTMLRSTDNGDNWTTSGTGMPTQYQANSLAKDNTYLFVVLLSNDKQSVYRSSDNGSNWSLASTGINSVDCLAIYSFNNYLYLLSSNDGVYRSSDHGNNWSLTNSGLTFTSGFGPLCIYGIKNYLFVGTLDGRIYRSTDNGNSWTSVYYMDTNPYSYTKQISSITSTNDIVFAGTAKDNLKSTDFGNTWTALPWTGYAGTVGTLNLLTAYGNYLFGCNGFNATVGGSKIWVYPFASNSWSRPPGQDAFNPTDGGYSGNMIILNNNYIIVSTMYNIWKSTLTQIGITPTAVSEDNYLPTEFKLEQNYPNPFNPSTNISWQLSVGSFVSLKVYDALGREVATLVNEYKPAGNFVKTFRGTSLPSGIYFYKLVAGSYSEIKKMILMK